MNIHTKRASRSQSRNTRKSLRQAVEALEGRLLLATYWVDDSVWSNGTTQAPADGPNAQTDSYVTYPGSQAAPYATLKYAVDRARYDNGTTAGDTIIVKAGTYRQYTYLDNSAYSGTSVARFTIQADPASVTRPIFKGSMLATTWSLHSGNIWKKTWANGSAWNTSANAQQVFVDGAPLTQLGVYPVQVPVWYMNARVGTGLADMAPGRFFVEFVNNAPQTLYVQLPDNSNPNNRTMEVSFYERLFLASSSVNYIDIKGLSFQHSNSSTESPDDSAVWILASTSATISDSDISYNDAAGLNASGAVQVLNNYIHHNGQLGITANGSVMGSANLVIRGNQIDYNNARNFNEYHAAGGIKAVTASGVLIEGNQIGFNKGPGVWFDIDSGSATRPNTIRNNYFHDNYGGNGTIMYEISNYGLIYNNIIANNTNAHGGVYISTSGYTKVYNNTIYNAAPTYGAITLQNEDRTGQVPGIALKYNYIQNNIVANTIGGYDVEVLLNATNGPVGNVINYNLYWNNTGRGLKFKQWIWDKGTIDVTTLPQWQAANTYGWFAPYDPQSWSGDPSFVSTTGPDFRTNPSGAGVNVGGWLPDVATDYGGLARPQGSTYDIGAREMPTAGPTNQLAVTGQTLSAMRSNYTGFIGFKFTTGSTPLVVRSLGRWVAPGNSRVHTVKLVDAANGQDVAGASASIATTSAPDAGYAYADLAAPVTLLAGHPYYLVTQETNGGDQWYDYYNTHTFSNAITCNGAVWGNGSYNLIGTSQNSYGPVNFKYQLQPFQDTFESGSASNWTVNSGSWSVVTRSGASKVYRTGASGGMATAGSSWSNYTVETAVWLNNVNDKADLLARVQDSTHYYYFGLRMISGVPSWVIGKQDGASWSWIAQGAVSYSANTKYILRFTVDGNRLTGSVLSSSGTQLGGGNAWDSAFTTGKIGLKSNVSTDFDDISVLLL